MYPVGPSTPKAVFPFPNLIYEQDSVEQGFSTFFGGVPLNEILHFLRTTHDFNK